MINRKMIGRVLGMLLFIELGMFLLCAGVSFTFFGMLPFYFSGSIDTITNAFFETMSGFTTTGATILDDIESLSHGMLFWRSLTQWIGGLGIVFFTIAILPIFTTGGVQLFSAESTGVTHDRTHPKINVMAKWLWTIYLVLTISETVLLMFGGMSLFDAVCQSFATTATGGYSTKQNSISYWNSPYIEYVVAIGATILDDIESLSHGMLFWRSLTQWIGGLGIVFFTIAILPIFTTGGVQLFSAESTGVTHDRTHPKINVMAKWLWTIYLVLTISETVLLMFGGMSLFDAVCQSFATTATGGYSTKQNSISYWNSPYIEYVVAIFMIVSSINFSLFLMCLKGKVSRLFKDEELHWFLASVGILTFLITLALVFQNHYDWELAFRKALFQVSTVHTSCGFATDDYNMWPPFTWLLLFIAMLSGGCTGSTSGGIKNMRLLIVARAIRNEFKHLLHPNAVLPVRINKQTVSSSIVTTVLIFFAFYLVLILIGWTVLLFLGVGFTESVSTVISSIGNVGPGLGTCGPAFSWNSLPDPAKWILSFLMLVGRLELFSVLLLFYPGFWKNR